MAQAFILVNELKKVLRESGKTYQDVARCLGLSEPSVKRLFATRRFSLDRLDKVCELVGIEIADLVRRVEAQEQIDGLTLAQEKELVSDPKLLLAAVLAVNRVSFDEILATYRYEETELVRLMARLDRMKLIEFLPGNRTKPLVSQDFKWIRRGPIQTYFEQQLQRGFLNSSFSGPGEMRVFVSGMISREANVVLQQKIQRLAQEFRHHRQEDLNRPASERHGTSLVIAMRPWEPEPFAALRRPGTEKVFK